MTETTTAGLDVLRRTISALWQVRDAPDGAHLSAVSARDLPGVIESLAFGLADFLSQVSVTNVLPGVRTVQYLDGQAEMAEAARHLGRVARTYDPKHHLAN